MTVITCIDDLKAIYVKKTPKMFYDYAESGSYTEQTFRENVSDFAKIRRRQRVARDLTGRSTESTMIGEKVAMPVALSPVGSCGMQSPDGEIKAARAAARETGSHPPPLHIRNAPTKLMKEIGYGAGYAYDHDAEDGFSGQNYFPDGMRRPVYYAPPERGFERELKKRIDYFAKLRAKRDS